MGEDITKHVHEKTLASRLMSVGAGATTDSLTRFSGWVLAGFGAALTTLLANLDKLSKYLSTAALVDGIKIFLCAVAVAVVSRLLAAVIGASVAASEVGHQMGRELGEAVEDFDMKVFVDESLRGLFPPWRWLFGKHLIRGVAGDLAIAGRMHSKLSQVHSILVLCELALCIWAGYVIACGLSS